MRTIYTTKEQVAKRLNEIETNTLYKDYPYMSTFAKNIAKNLPTLVSGRKFVDTALRALSDFHVAKGISEGYEVGIITETDCLFMYKSMDNLIKLSLRDEMMIDEARRYWDKKYASLLN